MFRLAPTPRDGETLYSVLARLGQYLNIEEAAPFMQSLTGRRWAIASCDLPGELMSLVRDIAEDQREKAVDRIIDRLTAFPFHTAFMPAHVRASVRQAMRGDVSGIHTLLGLATFKVRPADRLRFCPQCLDDMAARHGDLWWRREHQLPGVLVCPTHGMPLRASMVDPGERNRHSFIAATRAVCHPDALPVVGDVGPDAMRRLTNLARLAANVLDRPPEVMEHSDRSEWYRERLELVGLMRSPRKVDLANLHAAFRDRWSRTTELIPGLEIADDFERSWLTGMVRARRHAAHPLQHIMLGAMLDDMAPAQVVEPFGAGPWLCRNPIAEHHGRAVINEVVQRRDGGVLYGDFHCRCGYLYTVSRQADGTLGKPRYRHFGPSFGPALSRALARGDSLRTTARRFGLDPKTLMREAAMAGVNVPWSLKPSGVIPPARQVAAASAAGPAVKRSRSRPRRNWFVIDAQLMRSATAAITAIGLQRPPVRVTFAEVERRIARGGWVAKRVSKLPRTIQVIEAALEGGDAFKRRRLCACVADAVATGDLRPCEVLRAAGLPSSWLPAVRDALQAAQPSFGVVA